MCGIAGQVEEDAGVDIQLDAQLGLDCGDPFIKHVPMLPDVGPRRCHGLPGVAVERGQGVRSDPGEVESGGEQPQGQPGERTVLGGEQRESATQCVGAVGGDERLVPAARIGEQHPFVGPRFEGADQRRHGGLPEERQVRGEYEHRSGRHSAHPGSERRQRPATGRLLPRPDHGPYGLPPSPDDNGGPGPSAGPEHPVEQRQPSDREAGLVSTTEPLGGPSGEHHGVIQGHPASMGRGRALRNGAATSSPDSSPDSHMGHPHGTSTRDSHR